MLCGGMLSPIGLLAQQDSSLTNQGVPVIYQEDTLFLVYGFVGAFSPEARAEAVIERLDEILTNPLLRKDSVLIVEGENSTDIVMGTLTIMSVTDEDAMGAGQNRRALSIQYRNILKQALSKRPDLNSPKAIFTNLGLLLLAGVVLWLLFWGVRRLRPRDCVIESLYLH